MSSTFLISQLLWPDVHLHGKYGKVGKEITRNEVCFTAYGIFVVFTMAKSGGLSHVEESNFWRTLSQVREISSAIILFMRHVKIVARMSAVLSKSTAFTTQTSLHGIMVQAEGKSGISNIVAKVQLENISRHSRKSFTLKRTNKQTITMITKHPLKFSKNT